MITYVVFPKHQVNGVVFEACGCHQLFSTTNTRHVEDIQVKCVPIVGTSISHIYLVVGSVG